MLQQRGPGMLVSGNLSRLPIQRNFTPNLRQVPSGLTLAGDYTSVRFFFALVGVNERNGDLAPIDRQELLTGFRATSKRKLSYPKNEIRHSAHARGKPKRATYHA